MTVTSRIVGLSPNQEATEQPHKHGVDLYLCTRVSRSIFCGGRCTSCTSCTSVVIKPSAALSQPHPFGPSRLKRESHFLRARKQTGLTALVLSTVQGERERERERESQTQCQVQGERVKLKPPNIIINSSSCTEHRRRTPTPTPTPTSISRLPCLDVSLLNGSCDVVPSLRPTMDSGGGTGTGTGTPLLLHRNATLVLGASAPLVVRLMMLLDGFSFLFTASFNSLCIFAALAWYASPACLVAPQEPRSFCFFRFFFSFFS